MAAVLTEMGMGENGWPSGMHGPRETLRRPADWALRLDGTRQKLLNR